MPVTKSTVGDFTMKRFALGLALALPLMATISLPAKADPEPVEYVRVCDLYGYGYFYIPGTDICLNPVTGETRQQTEQGTKIGQTDMADQIDILNGRLGYAFEGIALAIALPQAIIQPGHTFAIAGNWGQFQGAHALGLSTAVAFGDHMMITGGAGIGLSGRLVGTRAGFNLSW